MAQEMRRSLIMGKRAPSEYPTTLCLNAGCQKPFKPTRPWQKFCSEKCRRAEWNRVGRAMRSFYREYRRET